MLIAANQIILNTYVCVPLCVFNLLWWTFTQCISFSLSKVFSDDDVIFSIIHIAESFMMSPKQSMDSNVFLVTGIRTLEITWACLQICGVFEGGLTVPSKVKSEVLRKCLLFHNSRPSFKKKKRRKQKQCVETDGCSFCDGVPSSLCFTVAAAERQSRPAVTWWAGRRPRWPLRLSGARLHHRLHRQTRRAHVPRQMVTSPWGFVSDWGRGLASKTPTCLFTFGVLTCESPWVV